MGTNAASASETDLPVAGASAPKSDTVSPSGRATGTSLTETRPNVRAVLEAGIGAGILFLLLEMLSSQFGASTPMGPARLTLKSLLGIGAGQATTVGLAGTLVVHFGLALTTTVILASMIHRWKTWVAITLGMAFGGLLYTGNVVIFAFSASGATIGSGLAIIVNYMAFGMAAAGIYKARQ